MTAERNETHTNLRWNRSCQQHGMDDDFLQRRHFPDGTGDTSSDGGVAESKIFHPSQEPEILRKPSSKLQKDKSNQIRL